MCRNYFEAISHCALSVIARPPHDFLWRLQILKIIFMTLLYTYRRVAVYLETQSVSHRRTHHMTQLFTYLLTHKLFSSCIRRYLVSRAATEWCQRYLPCHLFCFQLGLHFFNISLARLHQHCGVLLVLIRNIGHRTFPKIRIGTLLVRNVRSRERIQLILTVKMETRHFIERPFGLEVPAICNHCGVMKAWNRKTWKFWAIF